MNSFFSEGLRLPSFNPVNNFTGIFSIEGLNREQIDAILASLTLYTRYANTRRLPAKALRTATYEAILKEWVAIQENFDENQK